MTRESAALVGLLLFAPSPAVGQDSTFHTRKSAGAALAWSIGGTALPIAVGAVVLGSSPAENAASPGAVLLIVGGVLGPSLGHFYAGRPLRGAATATLRIVFVAVALHAGPGQGSEGVPSATEAFFLLAGAASAIVDVVTAPRSARSYNERWGLSLVPVRLAPRLGLAVRVAVPL